MLEIFRPDGAKFLSFVELAKLRDEASQSAEQESQRAEQERQRAEQESQRAAQERQRADEMVAQLETQQNRNEALAAKLRELGIDPDQIS